MQGNTNIADGIAEKGNRFSSRQGQQGQGHGQGPGPGQLSSPIPLYMMIRVMCGVEGDLNDKDIRIYIFYLFYCLYFIG